MKYQVNCRSNFSGLSVCKENGKIKYFEDRESAEKYAKECRDSFGVNYHYWVKEVDEVEEMANEFVSLFF